MTHEFRARAPLLWLLFASTLLFSATSVGYLPADPSSRFAVSEALLRTGDVAVPETVRNRVRFGNESYVVFFPGQSLLFLPVAALGVFGEAIGLSREVASLATRFAAVAFLIPFIAGLAVVGHAAVLLELGVRLRSAAMSAALLAVATPLWVYAGNGSEEPVLGACAIWAVWGLLSAYRLVRAGRADRAVVDRLGLAGSLLALGVTHRSTFVAVATGCVILSLPLWRELGTDGIRRLLSPRLAAWIAFGLVLLTLIPAYNWLRFGDPLDTGYARFYAGTAGVFSTPIQVGLIGHLASPGKSLFLFAPWLSLLPICLKRSVRRRLGSLGWAIAVILVLHLWIYSRFIFWGGDIGWGVRFHVSLMPLLTLPIGIWIAGFDRRSGWLLAVAGLAALSIAVQFLGVSLPAHLEHAQKPQNFTGPSNFVPADAAWTWRESQLRLRVQNVRSKLRGELEVDLPDLRSRASVNSWNPFPFRAQSMLRNPNIVIPLWVLWAAILWGCAFCAWQCTRVIRHQESLGSSDSS